MSLAHTWLRGGMGGSSFGNGMAQGMAQWCLLRFVLVVWPWYTSCGCGASGRSLVATRAVALASMSDMFCRVLFAPKKCGIHSLRRCTIAETIEIVLHS